MQFHLVPAAGAAGAIIGVSVGFVISQIATSLSTWLQSFGDEALLWALIGAACAASFAYFLERQ